MDRVFRMPLGAGSCCLGAVGLRVMRPALIPCRVRLPCWPQARGYRAGELARGRIRRTSVTEYSAGHSGLMPAARITFAHFSLSSTTSFPKSAGEPRTTVPPRSASRAFSLGSASNSGNGRDGTQCSRGCHGNENGSDLRHAGSILSPTSQGHSRCDPSACCARAASGHPTAAPPRSVMNARRLMQAVI
jgi:hypothetical protein